MSGAGGAGEAVEAGAADSEGGGLAISELAEVAGLVAGAVGNTATGGELTRALLPAASAGVCARVRLALNANKTPASVVNVRMFISVVYFALADATGMFSRPSTKPRANGWLGAKASIGSSYEKPLGAEATGMSSNAI